MHRILMVASEAAPFIKTGGLADVLGSFPAALVKRGEEVGVVLPRYRNAQIAGDHRILSDLQLNVGPRRFPVGIDQTVHNGVRYFFVDCPPLYDRAGLYNERGYDYIDNDIRFALLSQAALAVTRYVFPANILHAHDWQAGLLAPYLKVNLANDPAFFGVKCVITIHNLGYQGNFLNLLSELGLDPSLYHMDGMEFNRHVSFLKGGIVWSDAVTAVSPTYAKEIQTPEYGFGFDGLMRSRAYKLTGILNGVDYNEWSPENDPYISSRYSRPDFLGKLACKKALLKEFGLAEVSQRPLIGIVSRFADQKGFGLLGPIAGELAGQNLAFAVLGSGEARDEAMFRSMAAAWPDRVGLRLGYDEALAHRIVAGGDMLLMPSRYEPCGLTQMYALRYGTVPIVRATGGLEDTVDQETGFKFQPYTPEALMGAIQEALGAWQDRAGWVIRMRRGMAKDYSWDVAAEEYQRVYRSL
ncbi:MAG: glycogen synthase GlgA [Bryobacteraceae bacterium]|jgi:starch synthase